jgi:hypothetical protein
MKTQSIIKGLFAIIFTVFMFFNGKSQFNYTIENTSSSCDAEVSITIYDNANNICTYLPAFSIAAGMTEIIPTSSCSTIGNIVVVVSTMNGNNAGCGIVTLSDFSNNGTLSFIPSCALSTSAYTSTGSSSGFFKFY